MNSKERHEARYIRRVARRNSKKESRVGICNDFDAVFSFSNLYKAYKLSCRSVGWKGSVQSYRSNIIMNLSRTYNEIHTGTFKSNGFYEFDLFERGKLRHIRSVDIKERIVQRCLCDNCLVPIISRSFIYDNGASLKNKGITFSIERIKTHLHRFFREHNSNEGYILQYDFSKYFDTLPHKKVYEVIDKYITDERLNRLSRYFVGVFGTQGLGLGSQVSQILSLGCANDIDHHLKEVLRCRYYGLYMDDGYIISDSKEFLHECYNALIEICERTGITLNRKKTQIRKISSGFTFLKVRFFLTRTGRIIAKLAHDSVVRMRRKLKKFYFKVKDGIMRFADVVSSMQSWLGHTLRKNAYRCRMAMIKLFYTIFKDYVKGGLQCLKY